MGISVSSVHLRMLFLCITLLPLVKKAAPMVQPLGQGTGNKMYTPIDPEHYTPDEVYKAANKDDCHPVEKLTYVDECIPYVEKTCFTQQKELCKDVYEKNCTAVIDEYEERECFDVTELICQLGENVQYEMVDETHTVQRCTKVSDRICDTVYDLSITTKDDFQCVDIDYQYCWDEEKIVKDRTCIFSVDFDCGKYKPKDGKGAVGCQKTPTKKCYDTPRKVSEQLSSPVPTSGARSSPTRFPSPWRSRTATTRQLRSVSWRSAPDPRRPSSMPTPRSANPLSVRCARMLRRRNCVPSATRSRRTCAATSPRSTARKRRRNTASRPRRRSGNRSAPRKGRRSSMILSVMSKSICSVLINL